MGPHQIDRRRIVTVKDPAEQRVNAIDSVSRHRVGVQRDHRVIPVQRMGITLGIAGRQVARLGDLDQSASDAPAESPQNAETAAEASAAATVIAAAQSSGEESQAETEDDSQTRTHGIVESISDAAEEASETVGAAYTDLTEKAGKAAEDVVETASAALAETAENIMDEAVENRTAEAGTLPQAGNDDDPAVTLPPRAANDDEPKSA